MEQSTRREATEIRRDPNTLRSFVVEDILAEHFHIPIFCLEACAQVHLHQVASLIEIGFVPEDFRTIDQITARKPVAIAINWRAVGTAERTRILGR